MFISCKCYKTWNDGCVNIQVGHCYCQGHTNYVRFFDAINTMLLITCHKRNKDSDKTNICKIIITSFLPSFTGYKKLIQSIVEKTSNTDLGH